MEPGESRRDGILGEGCAELGYVGAVEGDCDVHTGSYSSLKGNDIVVVSLMDNQHVFVQIGRNADSRPFGKPLGSLALASGIRLLAYPTDVATLDRYLKDANPEKAPHAMGSLPRLGVGNRHAVGIWPAEFRAMEKGGFASKAIQNSIVQNKRFLEVTEAEWDRVIDINQKVTVFAGQAVATQMARQVPEAVRRLESRTAPMVRLSASLPSPDGGIPVGVRGSRAAVISITQSASMAA